MVRMTVAPGLRVRWLTPAEHSAASKAEKREALPWVVEPDASQAEAKVSGPPGIGTKIVPQFNQDGF